MGIYKNGDITTNKMIWLVVWNMAFIFPYIGNNHPNWLIFFQRGRYTTNQWFITIVTIATNGRPDSWGAQLL